MPRYLTPEEVAELSHTGYAPQMPSVGMAGRFGAAVDKTQASLYGLGEAAGLPLADLRRDNEAAADYARQQYFRSNPDQARSFKEVTPGNAGGWLAGLAVDSAPYMAGILGAGLILFAAARTLSLVMNWANSGNSATAEITDIKCDLPEP